MDIIARYTDYMENEKNLSKNTLEAYIRDVLQFKEYLSKNEVSKYKDANKTMVITYLMNLQKKGNTTSTISRKLASIRCFFQYLLNNNEIKEDPTLNLKSPKTEKKLPQILTVEEINLLLSQPKEGNFKGTRDKAMLELLYATGLKVSEIVSLEIESIDLELGLLIIKEQGNEQRVVPIGNIALNSLENYIANYRSDKDISSKDPLFINYSGTGLTRQGFWKIIKQYSKKSNIDKLITPQTLRHSFAVHLIENGADIKDVQEILGHSDLSTTQVYAFASNDNKLRKIYNKTHPRV